MSQKNNTLTPLGWYPNPEDSSTERFWDGNSWTDIVRELGLGKGSSEFEAKLSRLRAQEKSRGQFPLFVSLVGLVIAFVAKQPAIVLVVAFVPFVSIFFARRRLAQMAMQPEWCDVVVEYRRDVLQKSQARKQKGAVLASHKAGFESMGIRGSGSIYATDDGMVLEFKPRQILIPWADIVSVDAGTDDELRNRMTATRVLALGIFALGAKKEKKQSFFVTITTKRAVGLFELNTALDKNKEAQVKARSFATQCNSRVQANSPANNSVVTVAVDSPLDKLERLNQLLKDGVLTQEEFDIEKARVLAAGI